MMENKTRLFDKIKEYLDLGDYENASKVVNYAIERNVTVRNILLKSVLSYWEAVAKKFSKPMTQREEVEVFKILDKSYVATYRILFHLERKVLKTTQSPFGTIIAACVKGEGHTLIKDILALLFKAEGFKVIYNFGKGGDTPEYLVEKIKSEEASILLFSLTTDSTLDVVKKTVDLLKREGIRDNVLTIIGGRIANEQVRREVGADLYFGSLSEVIEYAETYLARRSSDF